MSYPAEIRKKGGGKMLIAWEDGHKSEYTFQWLRQHCPCALCINEITGEKMLDPKSVPERLQGLKAELVGNYALRFDFSDGHNTGIFTFELLRKICPCCKVAV